MPFIIRIFQKADNRSRSPNEFGELSLRETGLGAKLVNLPRYCIVSPCLFKIGQALSIPAVVTTVENFYSIPRGFSFFGHRLSLLMCVNFGILLEFQSMLHGPIDLLRGH